MGTPPEPNPFAPPPGQAPAPGPPGAPGAPGVPPWAYPSYGPPPVDGMAIASLVLGILCFLPGFGLVLGWTAVRRLKRRPGRGRGLAFAGMALSGAGLALLGLGLATGGVRDAVHGLSQGVDEARDRAGDPADLFALDKGDCFDSGGDLRGVTYRTTRVPCAGHHDAEVFASVRVPGGPDDYPGAAALQKQANDRCYPLVADYSMDSWALPGDVNLYFFTPTAQSWARGDHEISCLYGNSEESRGLTGSLRRDATVLTRDQVAYLRANRRVDDALDAAPESLDGASLRARTEWAGKVADALGEEAAALDGHHWPDGSAAPLAALVDDLGRARDAWSAAAAATDDSSFATHYNQGAPHIHGPAAVRARKALHLASTPPGGADDGPGVGAAA